jgi:hypothetical protein
LFKYETVGLTVNLKYVYRKLISYEVSDSRERNFLLETK